MRIPSFILIFLTLTTISNGQEKFSNTLIATESVTSPDAELNSIRWIEGHWRGEAFGGLTEEVWSPPLGGSMMCAFKLVVDGKIKFYELATISEEKSTLILRLKHFHPNLKGWEEKDKTLDFRLIKMEPGKIYFDQFAFERVDALHMNIFVVIENQGTREEVRFSYSKM